MTQRETDRADETLSSVDYAIVHAALKFYAEHFYSHLAKLAREPESADRMARNAEHTNDLAAKIHRLFLNDLTSTEEPMP